MGGRVLYATSNLRKGEKMKKYLVEYGANGWRDWRVVFAETDTEAETILRGRIPKASWAVVVDDVTDHIFALEDWDDN